MTNQKVFIGVGHGGNDPGAVANGLRESDITLNVSLEFGSILANHGVEVQLSRYKDENDDIAEEIRECNAFNPTLAIDVHVNAGGGDGFEIFHSIDQAYTKGLDKTLALNMEAEVKAIGQNSRGLKTKINSEGRDYFGFIRSVNCPSVIAEMAFIDNINDIKDFDELWEQKRYALALAKGVLKTLGIPYKTSTPGTVPTGQLYRIRKTWEDVASQKGAYSVLDSAITESKKYPGYSVFNETGTKVYPIASPTPSKRYLNLHPSVSTWRVYRTTVAPVKGNECGYLAPKQYGGISYEILATPQTDIYTINTGAFGKVNIYAPRDNDSSITNSPIY